MQRIREVTSKTADVVTADVDLRQAVEHLLTRMPPSVTPKMRLDWLEGLSWLVDDNGTELFKVRREWLRGTDRELLELALLPWSVRVAESRAEGEAVLLPLREIAGLHELVAERLAELE